MTQYFTVLRCSRFHLTQIAGCLSLHCTYTVNLLVSIVAKILLALFISYDFRIIKNRFVNVHWLRAVLKLYCFFFDSRVKIKIYSINRLSPPYAYRIFCDGWFLIPWLKIHKIYSYDVQFYAIKIYLYFIVSFFRIYFEFIHFVIMKSKNEINVRSF